MHDVAVWRGDDAPTLTPLQREIVGLVMAGLTDREIAARDPRPVEGVGEVLEMARARFGLPPEDREPPAPPRVRGRDRLTHRNTAKARFYREVQREDREKRLREGLLPWIRVVDGGAA